jgi:prolipoprotein diacylglyceryltransferase
MLPFLNLGPLALPTGPLVYLLGIWLALFAVDRAARRVRSVRSAALQRGEERAKALDYEPPVSSAALQRGEERAKALDYEPETYYALATTAAVAGFLGARLTFVLLHWSSYDDNLLGIVWPLTTGYNALGGALIGAAAGFFYGRWRRLALWPALDVLAPGLLVFLIAVSLADFLGGAGYGSLTSMPWGITVFGVRRHAVQLYEALVGVAALGAWWAATSPRMGGVAGRAFLWAAAVYAGGRLLVDAYRENAALVSGFHVTQIVALAVLLPALALLARAAWQDEHQAAE